MVKFKCPKCSKLLSLDEGKLPMREVQVPCPGCQTKIPVDRRKLAAAGGTATEATSAKPAEADAETAAIDIPPPAQPWPNSAGRTAAVVGSKPEFVAAIGEATKAFGFHVLDLPEDADLRDLLVREQPYMLIMDVGTISAPPSEVLAPVTSLSPADRRNLFLVVIADNLKSMDGNAAFLYQANVVICRRDARQFSTLLYEGLASHERLYAPFLRAFARA